MTGKPRVTVAAVVERDGRFLLIEEETRRGRLYNQPAGHLEHGESLIQAVVRETLEESAHSFTPAFLVGVYQHTSAAEAATYIRFAFAGTATGHNPLRKLDKGIVRTVWLSAAEARRASDRHRSPLVMKCIDDYLAGRRYPLEVLDCRNG